MVVVKRNVECSTNVPNTLVHLSSAVFNRKCEKRVYFFSVKKLFPGPACCVSVYVQTFFAGRVCCVFQEKEVKLKNIFLSSL